MPYITQDRRDVISEYDSEYISSVTNAGELNYAVTLLIIDYLTRSGLSYQTCNDIVGALDNAKDEFRRRVQYPYENKKILENGDVYPELFAPKIT